MNRMILLKLYFNSKLLHDFLFKYYYRCKTKDPKRKVHPVKAPLVYMGENRLLVFKVAKPSKERQRKSCDSDRN